MIKIKLSYQEQQEMEKVVAALKPLNISKISKEQEKPGHKNIYIEIASQGVKTGQNQLKNTINKCT